MKKTALLITLLLVFLVAGYLIYDKYYHAEPTTLWRLVPENAVAVFESGSLDETRSRLQENAIWNSLTSIEEVGSLNTWASELDSMKGSMGLRTLTEGDFLISLHVITKNSFDFLYLLDLNAPGSQRTLSELLEQMQGDENWQVSTHTYQEVIITELRKGERTFSYLIHDNKFASSFTPFLVEDVVRLITDETQPDFLGANQSLDDMPKLARDDGNLYVNMRHMYNFFSGFISARFTRSLNGLEMLGESSFFDLVVGDNAILLNGFTEDGTDTFLSTFEGQMPASANLKNMIPNSTAYLYEFLLSDPAGWHGRLKNYWSVTANDFKAERDAFFESQPLDPDAFFSTVGSSVSLLQIENPGDPDYTPVVLVGTKDMAGMMNQLNRLSESVSESAGDSLYIEKYGSYEIRELDLADVPRFLFGPQFAGFESTFYALVGEVVVMTPDIISLKDLIEAIQSENTWGRSVLYNQFLENTLEESNISVFVNARRAWEHTMRIADPSWREFAIRNSRVLKSFDLLSCQFSRLDERFYTSVVIRHDGSEPQGSGSTPLQLADQTGFDNLLITKPFVVRNHVNNSLETVVQDSSMTFYLVNSNGQISWGKPLNGPLRGEVEQLDYYRNNKLQYFFATPNTLHLIDRLGNEVEGYPIQLPHQVRYLSVLDYDRSRRYRYLVADEQGNLYMYDKEGNNLEGWQPRAMGSRLSSAPFHIRVRGKDFIIAIEGIGKVHALNRRGEEYPGFPLDLETRVETIPFVKAGATFEESEITVIDKDGKRVVFNLNGKIQSSEQLYKPTTGTEFTIIPDAMNKTYIIARLEGRRMVLMNQLQQELMAKDYLSAQDLEIQYYDFGSDVRVFVVADREQGFTYLYDQNGRLIGTRPLDSGRQIALLYSELNKEFTIYYVSNASLLIRKL